MITKRHMLAAIVFACVCTGACTIVNASENLPPKFVPSSNKFVPEGQLLSFDIVATDPNGDVITLAAGTRPAGTVFTQTAPGQAHVEWTPAFLGPLSAIGSPFRFDFVATDGLKSTQMSFYAYVQNVNRAPVIVAPESVTVEIGDPVVFHPSASDPDFDPLTWSVQSLPSGSQFLSPAPQTFMWTPGILDSGASEVTFIVRDNGGLADTVTTLVRVTVGPPYKFTIETDTVYPGEISTLEVALSNREAMSSFNLLFHFDPGVMSIMAVNPSGRRAAGFEYFNVTMNNGGIFPGDVRVVGIADQPGGAITPALAPGDGSIFGLNAIVSSAGGLAGLYLPVNFIAHDQPGGVDNTIKNGAGSQVLTPDVAFIDGGFMVRDQQEINIGDINLNGLPYEVGDAIRFTNYFINPFSNNFSAAQFANSDVNGDGYVASVADLVAMVNIITGGSLKVTSGVTADIALSQRLADDTQTIELTSNTPIAAARLLFHMNDNTLTRDDIASIEADVAAHNMTVGSHVENGELSVLVYSLNGGEIPSGAHTLVNVENLSGAPFTLDSAEIVTTDGQTVRVAYATTVDALPASFSLQQNYPNPFNPNTKIAFTTPRSGRVTLTVYDILGRSLRTLVDRALDAGVHVVEWDGTDSRGAVAPSGVYFYKMTAGEFVATRKMALVK